MEHGIDKLLATEERLEAIDQRLEAAAAKAECEARFSALVSSAWSAINLSPVSSLTTPLECHTSLEQRQQQQQPLRQKAFQSHHGVRVASSITREALPSPDRQQTRHRQDGSCSKRCPQQLPTDSLEYQRPTDSLEYQRRTREGPPPREQQSSSGNANQGWGATDIPEVVLGIGE